MKNIFKIVYLVLFLFISALVLYVSYTYEKDLVEVKKVEYFTNESIKLNKEIKKLIKNRQDGQLLILQQLVKDKNVLRMMSTNQYDKSNMKDISNKLEVGAGLKDTWFQFLNTKGVSVARSWTDKKGDNLSLIRDDVLSMINKPRMINSISVGWYEMTFKTMMPVYDANNKFLGAMELISNFDSLSDELDNLGYKAVFLVDKKYKNQIKHPRTNRFVDGYYVANKDADAQLLHFIETEKPDHFISPYHSYIIDGNEVVFNYALFDKKEMLIANFLIFKKLSSFNLKDIDETKIKMNIITGIILFLILAGFYVLSLSQLPTFEIDKTFYKLLVLFLLVYFLYFVLVALYYNDQKKDYMQAYNNQMKIDFENIEAKYSSMAELIYKTNLQTPDVLESLKLAQNPHKRQEAREKLYDLLKYDYELFKTVGVRQLHYHLKDNKSFLRFYKPEIYGDDLSVARESVKWVNKHHEKIEGFEEGKMYNGFRYIFPVFDEYDPSNMFYLGSVELSFSSFYLIRDLTQTYKLKGTFLIKTDKIDAKVVADQKENYVHSIYSGWSFDRAVSQKLKNLSIEADLSLIDKNRYKYIEERIGKGELFSVETNDGSSFFTFIPVSNPASNKVIAVIVLQKDKGIYVTLHNNTYIALLVGFILLMFVFLYMYKEVVIKKQYKLLLRKTQRILDAQESIIIITNSKEIVDVNKKFLDFFGFSSLEQFKIYYSCITSKFLDDDRLFDVNKFENKRDWMRQLETMDSKDKIVSMMDKNSIVHFFSIKDTKLDGNYLLEFSDISDTMKDKFQYINKAYKDKLTHAYNREYFDSNIENIIKGVKEGNNLGVIFCDIDYFKNVNDTFGHDVGDYVLKRMVEIVKKSIRSNDIVIRWGGEEFILLLDVDSMNVLVRIANTVREAIESEVFEYAGTLTCSFGLSEYKKGEDILQAIKRADDALYEAKESGRNRVKFKF